MDVIEAIKGRASTRAFVDKPVANETIHNVIDAARWAPSGTNTQPWQLAVVQGAIKEKISTAIIDARKAGQEQSPDYQYYPTDWVEPYKTRRFQCGMALYGALDIQRGDKERRMEVWDANYRFFDAPVGIFILIDKHLEKGSWMDLGMFIQNLMLSARGYGLETCPQAAMAEHPQLVRDILGIDDNSLIACGMALGYADEAAIINNYRTDREEVDNFTSFYA